jgi:single-strand DNA-binding protein
MNEPRIEIEGNLTADPMQRVSQSGKPWATFTVASTPRDRDKDGNYTDGEGMFFSCRAFGQLAENICASLVKGSAVVVTGGLTQRSYQDNDGRDRTSMQVAVSKIGPSLRFATAQVQRNEARGTGGYQHGAQGGSNANAGAGMGSWAQPAANGPQNGAQDGAAKMDQYFDNTPAFDDEQPF